MKKDDKHYIDELKYIAVSIAMDFFNSLRKDNNSEIPENNNSDSSEGKDSNSINNKNDNNEAVKELENQDGDFFLVYKEDKFCLTNKQIEENNKILEDKRKILNNEKINNKISNSNEKKMIEMTEISNNKIIEEKKHFGKNEELDLELYDKVKCKFSFINLTEYLFKDELIDINDDKILKETKIEFNEDISKYEKLKGCFYTQGRILCLLKPEEKVNNIDKKNTIKSQSRQDSDINKNFIKSKNTFYDSNFLRMEQTINKYGFNYKTKIEELKTFKLEKRDFNFD